VKHFTGRSPPQLDFQETREVSIKFTKIMEIYEMIRKPGKDHNRPYYPFFIYKIIEQMFKNDPIKIKLLESIHLQSSETLTKNDKLYRKICEMAPKDSGLDYTPTLRHK
jgi:hypothetical protein